MVVTNRVDVLSLPYSQLRQQVNNVRMEVSPLWRGPGNIHGIVLDGQFYHLIINGAHRPQCEGSNVNFTTIECGRWSFVTKYVKLPDAFLEQLSSWRYALLTRGINVIDFVLLMSQKLHYAVGIYSS